MKRLNSFINNVDIIRWLKVRNISNVFLDFLDSIMRLSIGQSFLILLILLIREFYFKDAVTVESITGSVYILYAVSAVVSAVVILLKSQEIRTIISSILKMILSLVVIGLTTSNIGSLEDCSNLVFLFVIIWILTKLSKRSIVTLDYLIQRSLYDFSRVIDDLSLLKENDILNLDRTDKVIQIVRQTRASTIEDQDLSTREISYHLSLIVKDYQGKSYDLSRLVYSRAYNEFTLIDSN